MMTANDFNNKFPPEMSCSDIADKLNIMSPEEAEPYDEVLCNDLFMAFCANYLTYKKGIIELITTSPEYKIFKRRYTNITVHPFFDAYVAFLEGRQSDVKKCVHEYMHVIEDDSRRFGESDVANILLAFKNAFTGFWPCVKKEIQAIPHDEVAVVLCDVIDSFYNAETNEAALEVLTAAYQKYPDCDLINEILGVTYLDGKNYGNAAAAYERLYIPESDWFNAGFHDQDEIYFNLGYANEKLKDRKTAIENYKKAVEINPFCPSAANNLGFVYYKDKQYDKAYDILRRCIDEKLDTDLTAPVSNFARVLYAMGRYKEAKEFIKSAPKTIPKVIREKIERAPDENLERNILEPLSEESEDGAEPVIKTAIERKGVQFQSEKILEDELTLRIEAGMEVFGLPLKIYRRRGEYGRQYIFPEGRLDILAEDKNGNLYIIELKKDGGYDDAYKQTVKYINWFQKNKAGEKKVYGIICLNSPGEALIEAARKDDRIKLYEYQISYTEIR